MTAFAIQVFMVVVWEDFLLRDDEDAIDGVFIFRDASCAVWTIWTKPDCHRLCN